MNPANDIAKDAAVEWAVQRMLAGEWGADGKAEQDFAARFDLNPDSARHLSAAAARLVLRKLDGGERLAAHGFMLARLAAVRRAAAERGDFAAVIASEELTARVVGFIDTDDPIAKDRDHEEVFASAIAELISDPRSRALMRIALAEWDSIEAAESRG